MPTFAVRPSLPGLISSHRLRLLMLIIAGIHRLVNSSIGEWVPLPPRFGGAAWRTRGAYPKSVSNCSILTHFVFEAWTSWRGFGAHLIRKWYAPERIWDDLEQGSGRLWASGLRRRRRWWGICPCRYISTGVLNDQWAHCPRANTASRFLSKGLREGDWVSDRECDAARLTG